MTYLLEPCKNNNISKLTSIKAVREEKRVKKPSRTTNYFPPLQRRKVKSIASVWTRLLLSTTILDSDPSIFVFKCHAQKQTNDALYGNVNNVT